MQHQVTDIESAIEKLPQKDLKALRAWFEEFDAKAWDQQFEADAQSGKLEALAQEAIQDVKQGRFKTL
ncbi:MAG: hypothetical protein IPJ69_04800 [Deltaproteobacteria bacterium]|nr:MAG: hypothetical protein IPJ69_04800 [Deltaproteobacteria bacterium]